MRDVLKVFLAIIIWASLGLGPGYMLAKHIDRRMDLGIVLILSGLGPIAGGMLLFYFTVEKLDTCILNCGEDL